MATHAEAALALVVSAAAAAAAAAVDAAAAAVAAGLHRERAAVPASAGPEVLHAHSAQAQACDGCQPRQLACADTSI